MSRTPESSNASAFRNFGLAAGGAVLAASAWAGGLPEEGLMLDARLWREEIVAQNDDGAEEGWYEITLDGTAVQVRAVKPRCGDDAVPEDAMYLHMPGAQLAEGMRVNHWFAGSEFRPAVGQEYRQALGKTEYSFRVDSSAVGTQYVISYDGVAHNYLLGLPAAATRVHAIADLDGDRKPDFVVEVGDQLFLLLSTHAKPGTNLPSAQLWAAAQ